MKKSFVALVLLSLGVRVWARPVASVKEVRTVYDGGSRGNTYFNSQLRSQMRGMGIRFVKKRQSADAILHSRGIGTEAGGFSGSASLLTPGGKTLWSARVARAPRSRAMAFDSLAAKLRAARR
ncbi:hypothetical protein IAD21_03391 [Abditibacteriota bacterium]|nr:hypothetical protein IAD21_03391 [Abditibacteriota bacterium]